MTTIALSRLLINLREVSHGSQYTMTPMSTLRFSQVIGPLGNTVDDGLSSIQEDEDHERDDREDDVGHIQAEENRE